MFFRSHDFQPTCLGLSSAKDLHRQIWSPCDNTWSIIMGSEMETREPWLQTCWSSPWDRPFPASSRGKALPPPPRLSAAFLPLLYRDLVNVDRGEFSEEASRRGLGVPSGWTTLLQRMKAQPHAEPIRMDQWVSSHRRARSWPYSRFPSRH